MDTYGQLCKVMDRVYDAHIGLEQKFVAASEFKDISVNDMHVLDAIGPDTEKNMSSVAKTVGVTVGTLTIAVNGLVKKGYVLRKRSEKDRRVVLISLSERGALAYAYHQKFYEKMGYILGSHLEEKNAAMLAECLGKVLDYL